MPAKFMDWYGAHSCAVPRNVGKSRGFGPPMVHRLARRRLCSPLEVVESTSARWIVLCGDAPGVGVWFGHWLGPVAQVVEVGGERFGHALFDFLTAGAEGEDTLDIG